MKVEVEGKDILVNAINYSNKLELLGHYQDVFKPVHENNGEVSQKEFNALLGHTSELAFSNSDNFEKKYKLNEQINILTKILMQYLGLSDKEKKDDGG